MITSVTIRNFKGIEDQTYEFERFDLLVGTNNSGKSTVLQALVIWQYCVEQQDRWEDLYGGIGTTKEGEWSTPAIPFSQNDFNVFPLSKIDMLWFQKNSSTSLVIIVNLQKGNKKSTISAKISELDNNFYSTLSWDFFYEDYHLSIDNPERLFPNLSFVPTFSSLEAKEEKRTEAAIRNQVGRSQAGSVLRNLLLRVAENAKHWQELSDIIQKWFGVSLLIPHINEEKDVYITCEYEQNGHKYDIIAGGSGFHQILILLAFIYHYKPTTILLDEPDAHLHVNLQSEILQHFKELETQFIIATHSEAFINQAETNEIISLLGQKPHRIENKKTLLDAMRILNNSDALQVFEKKKILYLEGEDDERLLRGWESVLSLDIVRKFHIVFMRGGSDTNMVRVSDEHFKAVQEIEPLAKRIILLDDDGKQGKNITSSETIAIWNRRNIENYLLVESAWIRALGEGNDEIKALIQAEFSKQRLQLQANETWQTVSANIFKNVNGKEILFEGEDALYHQIKTRNPSLNLNRSTIASTMLPEEIHQDVIDFFDKLKHLIETESYDDKSSD